MNYHEQELERRRQAAKENALRVAFPDRYKESHDISTKSVETQNVEAKPKVRKSKAADKPVFIEQPTVAVASYEEPLSVQSSDHSTDGDRRGQ
jgi:hypothetical protein